MAGITGIIGLKENNVYSELIDAMFQMKHRGLESFWGCIAEKILQSNRLKELQEKKTEGNTGICCNCNGNAFAFQSKDKKFSLVYDGKIYNFETSGKIIDFFEEGLKKKKSIEEICREFALKANGQYAIIVKHGNKVFAFRDWIGIKPLWFGKSAEFMAVCSEPKPLRKMNINFPQALKPGNLLVLDGKEIEIKELFAVKDFRKQAKKKAYSEKSKIKRNKGKENNELQELKKSLVKAVELRAKDLNECGVLFSGGIDSSLIAKLVGEKVKKVKLITVGLKDSYDLVEAEKVAKELGMKFCPRIMEKEELPYYVFKALEHLPYFDQMQLAIGAVELIAAEHASKIGLKICFSGQGADEIFLGYSYYKDILEKQGKKAVEEKKWSVLEDCWTRNLIRDDLMASVHGIETRMPFLDKEFLEKAMNLEIEENIKGSNDELRKHALRKIALELGVPKSAAEKKKKALQYGSGIGKEITKMFAKKAIEMYRTTNVL